MWFPHFYLTDKYSVENMVSYEYMGRSYSITKSHQKQTIHESVTKTSITTTKPDIISQENDTTDTSITDLLLQETPITDSSSSPTP